MSISLDHVAHTVVVFKHLCQLVAMLVDDTFEGFPVLREPPGQDLSALDAVIG
jgi:hypothetical protein